jgi:hypothetical protein
MIPVISRLKNGLMTCCLELRSSHHECFRHEQERCAYNGQKQQSFLHLFHSTGGGVVEGLAASEV